ncbi:MAG: hypothetical protein EPO24_03790 [Bacteroidetes bacterium]|nr:MAG: hypothetical protein EPO24_03790 [Bacteroidota bacterium]
MNVMFDLIGSVIVLGIVVLIVLTMNINLTSMSYQTNNTMQIQFQAIQLSRIMEFDMYKIGYRVVNKKILKADSSNFSFRANLFDTSSDTDVVEYKLVTPQEPATSGPTYKMLIRKVNSDTLAINNNVSRFYFSYYTSKDSLLTPPISGSWLDSIKSVKVYLALESFDSLDSTFIGALYSKWIYPRNL